MISDFPKNIRACMLSFIAFLYPPFLLKIQIGRIFRPKNAKKSKFLSPYFL